MNCLTTLHKHYSGVVSGVKAIQWGIEMEETAIRQFEEHTGHKVNSTGLWLHSSGILGASPDRFIYAENAVLEVKCPYSARNLTVAQACTLKDFCLTQNEQDGSFALPEKHKYVDQVQGQMYLTGSDTCFLVVYTTVEIAVVKVEKSDKWKPNIEKLISFYCSEMLPRLVGVAQNSVD